MCVELVIGISSDVGSSVNQMHVSSGICQFTSEDAACKAGTDDQNSCLMSGHRYFRSEEHTSELQSLMRSSYDVFCLNKKTRRLSLDGDSKRSASFSHITCT